MKVSNFKREDVPRMVLWGKHSDERFISYNFDMVTKSGFDMWYRFKNKPFVKKIFKVEVDSKMVGFITLRKINYLLKTAELGIVFDPNNISKGYGTEALTIFLNKVKTELKLKTIYLRVADFNIRAKKVYLKVGFKEYKNTYEPFEYQKLNEIIYKKFDGFDLVDGVLYTNYTYMKIQLTS